MEEKNKNNTKNKRLWKQQIIEENNGNQKLVQKINKIDKTLAKLKERERDTNCHYQDWTGNIITEPTDTKMIIKEYYGHPMHIFSTI